MRHLPLFGASALAFTALLTPTLSASVPPTASTTPFNTNIFASLKSFVSELTKAGSDEANARKSAAAPVKPDLWCFARNCFQQGWKCATNAVCREALNCMGKCAADDDQCHMSCMVTYDSREFDAFINCAVFKHKCLPDLESNKPFTCHEPSSLAPNFQSLSQLTGSWYIVGGLNPAYDCFDCQVGTFYVPQNAEATEGYRVEEYFVKTLLNTTRKLYNNETISQWKKAKGEPGKIFYRSGEEYLFRETEWQVVGLADDGKWAVMSYCGNSGNLKYEGLVVYGREPVLTDGQWDEVKGSLRKRTVFDAEGLCRPKTTGCWEGPI
ncbi:Vitamin D3 receptor [Quaeritorhiza haematococci]|nr:Vitamin D3 receptor [Quaeritorhiza haematococci]